MVINLVDRFGVPFDGGDGLGDINFSTITDRLAAINGFHHRKFMSVAGDKLTKSDQHIFALCGMRPAPATFVEGTASFFYRFINISFGGLMDSGDRFSCRRIGNRHSCTAAFSEAAINEGF